MSHPPNHHTSANDCIINYLRVFIAEISPSIFEEYQSYMAVRKMDDGILESEPEFHILTILYKRIFNLMDLVRLQLNYPVGKFSTG